MQNELSDIQTAADFQDLLNSKDTDAIEDRRRAISLIASNETNFAHDMPLTYRLTLLDIQALSAEALGQHESNIIGFLEERGYSAKVAYQMTKLNEHEAA